MIYLEDTSGPVRVLVANGRPKTIEGWTAMDQAMETRRRLDSSMATRGAIPPMWKKRKVTKGIFACDLDRYTKRQKKRVNTRFTWGGARPGAGRPRKESNAR